MGSGMMIKPLLLLAIAFLEIANYASLHLFALSLEWFSGTRFIYSSSEEGKGWIINLEEDPPPREGDSIVSGVCLAILEEILLL
jgi:hypothetical protein